jgi:hypothetical protein
VAVKMTGRYGLNAQPLHVGRCRPVDASERNPPQEPDAPEASRTAPHRGIVAIFRAAEADANGPDAAGPELLPVRLSRAAASVLAVDAAGFSVLDGDFRVPLGASDDVASLAERLQFTQGEGPCLDAARRGRALVADAEELSRQWPVFAHELLARTPFRGIMALPLAITDSTPGALDLYVTDVAALRSVPLADAAIVADCIVEALDFAAPVVPTKVEVSELPEDPVPSWLVGPSAQYRRLVWLAMGMAMSKFGITAPDALALLRAHAYGHDTVLDEVAAELVRGTLTLAELNP